MPGRLANAEITDRAVIAAQVTPAIAQTAKRQVDTGIDCIGDGEFWTARSLAHYTVHFTGIEARPVAPGEPPTTRHSTRSRASPPKAKCGAWRAGKWIRWLRWTSFPLLLIKTIPMGREAYDPG